MIPGQSFTNVMALAKMLQGTETKQTDSQRKASSALDSITSMETLMGQDPSVLWKQYLPWQAGDPEAQMFETAKVNIVDAIARMRTGAVINASEEKLYRKFVPKITDTPANISYKIGQLRAIFGSIAGGNGAPTTTDLNLQ
jgi:hypothetical protein